MRYLWSLLLLLCLPFWAAAQQTLSLEIDQASLAPIHKDALTGVAIDKIEPDYSKRPCARIKLHINRMSREDINGISIKVIGGNVVVMKRLVAAEGTGLIIELTAKPETRFYLHHDKYGDSNQVNLNLEGNKEYRLNAQLNMLQTIVVSSNVMGAEVYIDNEFKGSTDSNFDLSVKDMTHGSHKLRVVYGEANSEQDIVVSSTRVHFRLNIKHILAQQQHVLFKVEQRDAVVMIDGRVIPLFDDNNTFITSLDNGSYSYSVTAKHYHEEKGTFIVNGAKVEKSISLRPAHGWLHMTSSGALHGAKVYIDGKQIGTVPFTSDILPSGEYNIRIVKEYYKDHVAKITIKDNETLSYSPQLDENFANVSIRTYEESNIYINGSYKGKETWSGKLLSGSYTFESRKSNHHTRTMKVNISPSPTTLSYDIPAPAPILGKLKVNSSPSSADVFVDSELVGRTPLEHDLIIGHHLVVIRKDGFDDKSFDVKIEEGKTASFTQQLMANAATITVSVDGDFDIYVDEEYKGTGSWSGVVNTGSHKFEARAEGYHSTFLSTSIESIPSHHNIVLDKPTPIMGTIDVRSMPLFAGVYIDNIYVGSTPLKKQVVVGNHKVEIRKSGYKQRDLHNIYVKENRTIKLKSVFNRSRGYKGFESMAAFSYLQGLGNTHSSLNWTYTGGYRFNPYIYIGAGVGISYNVKGAPDILMIEDDSFDGKHLNLCAASVPLYAYVRANMTDERCAPFFAVAAGGNLSAKQKLFLPMFVAKYNTSTMFVNPQFGVEFATDNCFKWYISLGFNCHSSLYCSEYTPYSANLSRKAAYAMDFHVGFIF